MGGNLPLIRTLILYLAVLASLSTQGTHVACICVTIIRKIGTARCHQDERDGFGASLYTLKTKVYDPDAKQPSI